MSYAVTMTLHHALTALKFYDFKMRILHSISGGVNMINKIQWKKSDRFLALGEGVSRITGPTLDDGLIIV